MIWTGWRRLLAPGVLVVAVAQAAAAQTLAAAVLPSGRSVTVGTTATAYASLINSGSAGATACRIAPVQQVPATFTYQTASNGNVATGTPNTPVDIPAGGTQNFILSFTPTAAFAPTEVGLSFVCANAPEAPIHAGLNTMLLSASATGVPDIIANAATTTNDGIAHIPSASGTGFFATAGINIGTAATLTVTPVVVGGAQVQAAVCQTNPATGACLAPPSASVSASFASMGFHTFAVFLTGQGSLVAPDFATRRVKLEFRDAGGAVRGSTSVAVCTTGAAGCVVPVRQLPYVAVSTDMAQNTYPSTYTTVAVRPEVDVCNIRGEQVFYPPSWNGNKPLPPIVGAPLNPGFIRMVGLKDILPTPPATLPARCGQPNSFTDDNYVEAARVFARLKAMNVDYVEIDQPQWAYSNPDGSFSITPYAGNMLNDAQMTRFVELAHAAGLKVMVRNTIPGFITVTNDHGCYCLLINAPPSTPENWTKWLTVFRTYMLNRAVFYQSLNVELWNVGCQDCVYGDRGDNSPAANEQFGAAFTALLPELAAIYKGKKYISYSSWLSDRPSFVAGMDFIQQGFFHAAPLTLNENTLTVADVKAAFNKDFSGAAAFGKPLIIPMATQSRGNFMSLPGYVEEITCTDRPGTLFPSPNACIQRDTPTDFSLQAIFIEAYLELAAGAGLPAGSGVYIGGYWQTDFMGDGTGPSFPQLGNSLRNKPAEAIMKAWFAR